MIQIVDAKYQNPKFKEFDGNPLIEAISDAIFTKPEMLMRELACTVEWNSDIDWDNRLELQLMFDKVSGLYVPLPIHYTIYSKLIALILSSYQQRNPFDAQLVYEKYKRAVIKPSGAQNYKTVLTTGRSGIGKSRFVERLLSVLFPEVIKHTFYQGRAFQSYQIPYLKVSLRFDGKSTMKSLLLDILKEIDKKIGSDYFESNVKQRRTESMLYQTVSALLLSCNVGVLIFDELQNMKNLSSLLSHIGHIVNTFPIPIIFISTPEVFSNLDTFATARRVATENHFKLEVLEKKREFKLLVNQLFKLKLNGMDFVLNDDLLNALYSCTLGITSVVILLYRKLLEFLVDKRKTSLSVADIFHVFESEFNILKPLLKEFHQDKNDGNKILVRDEKPVELLIKKYTQKFECPKITYDEIKSQGLIDDLDWCIK